MEQLEIQNGEARETLAGTLERVVFHNEENGWTVFRMNVEDREDSVAVVGVMAVPQPGARIRAQGRWVNHPRFGRQFQMETWKEELPATEEGIRLFLASGCIRGIGPKWADRIVERFGAATLDIMDTEPERMLELPRFGKKRLAEMKASWQEHQGIRELMIFLQPHGVTAGTAMRIYREYGQDSLEVVRENPYRLAMDIRGIGFTTADALAKKLGFEESSPLRAEAAMLYQLVQLTEEGHVYYPRDLLLELAEEKLAVPAPLGERALDELEREERVVLEDLGDHTGVYLTLNHRYESQIAFYLKRLLHSPKSVHFSQPRKLVASVIREMPFALAEEQKQAVYTAASSKVMVLTGGPGTGKTTILNAVIKVFQEARARILLAAPTGRAAKRMSEASGLEARTIHRLLEYSPSEDGFKRNENNPLACGLLVVDEASMMDTMLMYHLVKAAPLGATFILVGDVNQLPSVGPGNVLRDVIASGVVPVVELVEVFRQAAESDIICNAHRINKGELPELNQRSGRKTDFYFFRQEDPEAAASLVVELVQDRIPRTFGFRSEDIQVLSPMLRGAVGVNSLNRRLQDAVNPQPAALVRGDRQFRLNDRVMQIRNNYDKDVFNGDTGTIIYLDTEERELTVRFDDRAVDYLWEEMDELIPAYAISIHKSQGGEYPVVVIPLMMQHFMLLQRNLVYTAVTRGRKLVVLVGEWKALAIAVKNNHIRRRYTWLAHRLAGNEGSVLAAMLPETGVEQRKVREEEEEW
ncbi:ATP-dependent RecD-like DNA helicase [uncultured Mailhella sp.]|uniref:SF1B family DNA helicase RecD2 n=1 Tax=uncultured Mailhella sp. TaxID=1981031 RepID=UPI002616CE21|nr:ATP-dependent RecD-like DNA helicase [uncultured Mailhella sp.]